MNESKSNIIQRFLNSVNGFNGYRSLLYEPARKAVVFLLLLTTLLGAVVSIKFALEYNAGMSIVINEFDKQVPDFRLENGKLTVEGKMPIIIKGEGSTLIIDTSESANESILNEYDNAILITRTEMIQKNYANKTYNSFSSLKGFVMTKDTVRMAIPLMRWFAVFIVIFGTIFFIAGKFISALLISIVGSITNAASGTRLIYRDIYKFSLYAMTLPLILCTILDLVNVPGFVTFFLFYILSSVYVWGGIRAVSSNMQDPGNNIL